MLDNVFLLAVLALADVDAVLLGVELEGAASINASANEFESAVSDVTLRGFHLKMQAIFAHFVGEVAVALVVASDGILTLVEEVELDVLILQKILLEARFIDDFYFAIIIVFVECRLHACDDGMPDDGSAFVVALTLANLESS